MDGRFHLTCGILLIIWGALYLLSPPDLAQAKEGGWERLKNKVTMVREFHDLGLPPDKVAALQALDQKYARERQELLASLRKCREDLKLTLAAPSPDEAKIKDLVSAANTAQDKLLASVRMERDDAMSLMTPVQQGQLMVLMDNWLQKMVGKGKVLADQKAEK